MLTSNFVNKRNNFEIKEIWNYLQTHGVVYDNPEVSVVVRDQGKIIGTGSLDGKVMKYFFLEDDYKGQGILAQIYNMLLTYLLDQGITEHFIFTKPENYYIFKGIGLKKVIETDKVLLLEGGFTTYKKWVKSIKDQLNPNASTRGAIVANCNPMTKGHKFLMEYAKSKVDELIIFVVEENKSVFPTEVRYNIVKNEYKNDPKVLVVKGGNYIISQGTFPTYFLKKVDDSLDIYTELDAKIFSQRIAKDLDIDIRFVGDEPIDRLTAKYNEKLYKSTLGVKLRLEKIDRKEEMGSPISASRVRKLIKEGKLEEAYSLLVDSTIEFLKSPEGKKIIKKIQESES